MPQPFDAIRPDPRLNRTLWQWLALGALSLLVFPSARGFDAWLGWLPFWAVIAPLSALLIVHRHVLMTAWRGILVPAPRRRRQRETGGQARSPRSSRAARRQSPRAA